MSQALRIQQLEAKICNAWVCPINKESSWLNHQVLKQKEWQSVRGFINIFTRRLTGFYRRAKPV